MSEPINKANPKIIRIDVTNEKMTSRGGLSLFVRYLEKINIFEVLLSFFGGISKSSKGASLKEKFKQIFCFFMDGTSYKLTRFEELKKNESYAGTIESDKDELISSHSAKRFMKSFSFWMMHLFRKILIHLFIWRLRIDNPSVIILGIDSMVMDNDDAKNRQGVSPTYKKKEGFHPLQMTYGKYMIDAIFRGGSKHCNHGRAVINMVKKIKKLIRKKYDKNVPILLRLDAGFFDQENFKEFEKLGIAYICGGKMYGDIKEYVANLSEEQFNELKKGNITWEYTDFDDKRDSWNESRRAIYTRVVIQDKQRLLENGTTENIIYTNISADKQLTEELKKAGLKRIDESGSLVNYYHGRARDELVHRSLKDFGTEQLPFKRFTPNMTFYYLMVLAFNLFQAYKDDVGQVPEIVKMYASTFRRKFIDFAAKIVSHGGQMILKVTKTTLHELNLQELWKRCNNAPLFSMT